MRISKTGLEFLEAVEAKIPTIYPDQGGELTIGIGHLMTKSEIMSGKLKLMDESGELLIIDYRKLKELTDPQMYGLLRYDLITVEDVVNSFVRVSISQNQYEALVSFCFNVGNQAFKNSTLLKQLNAGMYAAVPHQMRRWIHVKGKISKGLINRRENEIKLWNGQWKK